MKLDVGVFEYLFELGEVAAGRNPLNKGWPMKAPSFAHPCGRKLIFTDQTINSMLAYSQEGSSAFYVENQACNFLQFVISLQILNALKSRMSANRCEYLIPECE